MDGMDPSIGSDALRPEMLTIKSATGIISRTKRTMAFTRKPSNGFVKPQLRTREPTILPRKPVFSANSPEDSRFSLISCPLVVCVQGMRESPVNHLYISDQLTRSSRWSIKETP